MSAGNIKNDNKKSARIVADHLRSTVFLLADGVAPSNKDRGYILRRIMRRLVVHSRKLAISQDGLLERVDAVVSYYGEAYPEIVKNIAMVKDGLAKEYDKFSNTLFDSMLKFNKMVAVARESNNFVWTMA